MSGTTKNWPILDLGDDGFARRADAGVDDAYEDRVLGEVGSGAGEEARALGDVVGRDLVGDVDDADAGSDAIHDGFADADGVVFDVEVGHEADDFQGLRGGGGCGGVAGGEAEGDEGGGDDGENLDGGTGAWCKDTAIPGEGDWDEMEGDRGCGKKKRMSSTRHYVIVVVTRGGA